MSQRSSAREEGESIARGPRARVCAVRTLPKDLRHRHSIVHPLDADGFHVKTTTGVHYIPFETSCDTSLEVRAEMVRLAQEAQAPAGS